MRFLLAVSSMLLIVALVVGCGPVTDVRVNPREVTIAPGATQQFEAYAYDRTGNIQAGASLTWKSSNPAVATVDANGLVTAVAPGRARISANHQGIEGSGIVIVSGPAVAPVPPPPPTPTTPPSHIGVSRAVTHVVITPATFTVAVGERRHLLVDSLDALNEKVGGADYTWDTSNPAVARVSQLGVVTGVAPGTAEITATEGPGLVGRATVTVTTGRVTGVTPPAVAPTPTPPTPPTVSAPAPAPSPTLTYSSGPANTRVKPIIDRRCVGCHKPGGMRAQTPLTNYAQVKATVDSGLFVSKLNGSMAPYAGPDRPTLIKWAQQGAPQ